MLRLSFCYYSGASIFVKGRVTKTITAHAAKKQRAQRDKGITFKN